MPNQLTNETSPYLLQHAGNPVDWYPWGPEALEKARAENKPIFLSIGYAACHWCHVMAHESFEDAQTAEFLNAHFVPIKVDREERPDLDNIYMTAVVAMTGQGGWPMSVFLTPDGEPFFGGTYFPNTRRYGMPSFREVLEAVARSWQSDNGEIRRVSRELTQHIQEAVAGGVAQGSGPINPSTLEEAVKGLLKQYDWTMGGWGRAPRFPQAMAIDFLLMQATRGTPKALDAAAHALAMMSRGGMYDLVGGGFHRYSTDDRWLVPHFEKMLYDNGQLALAYLHASLLTGNPWLRQVCTETLDFILREMTHPDGGFYSSLDADSEGVEGKYYVWTPKEIHAALIDADDLRLFEAVYPIPPQGNFEGKIILQRESDLSAAAEQLGLSVDILLDRLSGIHQKLNAVREQRVRPATDDKVLVMWNALALRAFAEAARYLNRPDYLEAARKNAHFLLTQMHSEGRLLRAWRAGQARHNAYLEDYAGLILALLALYESDPDLRWYQSAVQLAEEMDAGFRDPQGGFFDTRSDQAALITRPKEVQDNATPSGSALACGALLRLSAYDESGDRRAQAEGMLVSLQSAVVQYPTAFGFWLQDLDFALGPVRQIAVLGPLADARTRALLDAIWANYRPRIVAAASAPGFGPESPALLHDRDMIQNQPTAYVCEGFVCNLPVNTVEGLEKQLQG